MCKIFTAWVFLFKIASKLLSHHNLKRSTV